MKQATQLLTDLWRFAHDTAQEVSRRADPVLHSTFGEP